MPLCRDVAPGSEMLYITTTRLMLESERVVQDTALVGEEIPRRACSQLIADRPRYSQWHSHHELRMDGVAKTRRREPAVERLRALAVEQVHKTALVSYLRDGRVVGSARDRTLRLFYGPADIRDATLVEHRNYLLAASTQLCAHDLLGLVGDDEGLALIRTYELAYHQYFSLFCERGRAAQAGESYLLGSLLPEVKGTADRLRQRILGTRLVAHGRDRHESRSHERDARSIRR
jgi:hypothetical protein